MKPFLTENYIQILNKNKKNLTLTKWPAMSKGAGTSKDIYIAMFNMQFGLSFSAWALVNICGQKQI